MDTPHACADTPPVASRTRGRTGLAPAAHAAPGAPAPTSPSTRDHVQQTATSPRHSPLLDLALVSSPLTLPRLEPPDCPAQPSSLTGSPSGWKLVFSPSPSAPAPLPQGNVAPASPSPPAPLPASLCPLPQTPSLLLQFEATSSVRFSLSPAPGPPPTPAETTPTTVSPATSAAATGPQIATPDARTPEESQHETSTSHNIAEPPLSPTTTSPYRESAPLEENTAPASPTPPAPAVGTRLATPDAHTPGEPQPDQSLISLHPGDSSPVSDDGAEDPLAPQLPCDTEETTPKRIPMAGSTSGPEPNALFAIFASQSQRDIPKRKAFACTICGATFLRHARFRYHMLNHRSDPLPSPPLPADPAVCTTTSPGPSTFAEAASKTPTKHPSADGGLFCQMCPGASFPSESTLATHNEFVHNKRRLMVVLQKERIFTASHLAKPAPRDHTINPLAPQHARAPPSIHPPPPAACQALSRPGCPRCPRIRIPDAATLLLHNRSVHNGSARTSPPQKERIFLNSALSSADIAPLLTNRDSTGRNRTPPPEAELELFPSEVLSEDDASPPATPIQQRIQRAAIKATKAIGSVLRCEDTPGMPGRVPHAADNGSQDLFVADDILRRRPAPLLRTTRPPEQRTRPAGAQALSDSHRPHTAPAQRGAHKLSAARCPEEDLEDTPDGMARRGRTLHVSFPMQRCVHCPEPSCPFTSAGSRWTNILQSIKRHLSSDHGNTISHVKKWCILCPAVCPDRVSHHPCFKGRDPIFEPEEQLTFRCEACDFQCANRRQLRNHAALHRNVELRVPRAPFQSASLHPSRQGRDRTRQHPPTVPTARADPAPGPSTVPPYLATTTTRQANTNPQPRTKSDWFTTAALESVPRDPHHHTPSPLAASSPTLPYPGPSFTPTTLPPPPPADATIDEVAGWIAGAGLPPPPAKKKRRRTRNRRRRSHSTASSGSEVDPAILERMRREITPDPSTHSSLAHSPSQAFSHSAASHASPVAPAGEDNNQSTQDPAPLPDTPPEEEDCARAPLANFNPGLNLFLSGDLTISDTAWDNFEELLADISTSIGEHCHITPPRDETVTRPPAPIDACDHRTIQRLYRRNRRRAIRLITEGEGTRCHLEGETIMQHFNTVFQPSSFDPEAFPPFHNRTQVNMDPFSPEEVKARLFKFENSAPGPDRISYAHLKEADPECTTLAKVLNICLKAKRIPEQWKSSRTILLLKKGDPELPENWRPISLCSTLYKLLAGCLASRLTAWLTAEDVLSRAQKGFMPFDGTFEHHFLVERELRRTKTHQEDLCMAQIDLANAFGSVPHGAISTALLAAGAGQDFTTLIGDIYTGSVTEFLAGDGATDRVEVRNGVRQGCPLSGPLFNLVIDPLIRGIQSASPRPDGEYNVLAFADDLLLIAKSPESLQLQLDLLPSLTSRLGLAINPLKCCTVHLSGCTPRGHRITEFHLDGTTLEVVPDHVPTSFLGHPIGFQLFQNTGEVDKILALGKKIGESCLAPWQRIDALKSFFYPALNFPMRTKGFSKEQLRTIDEEMRKFIKVTLNLIGPASVASNHYIYGASDAGCLGIPCLEDEHDVVCVDSAFKLLTSRDDVVRRLAWDDLAEQIEARISSFDDHPVATPALVEDFLSGSCEAPFHRARSNLASVWSSARIASRKLGVQWGCHEWGTISITHHDKTLSPADRRTILRSIKSKSRNHRAELLQQYPSQGVAMECVAASKWGNQFLRTGENIRFCDWRFIHKARLNLCNLNGQRFSSGNEPIDRSCRRCSHQHETLHHVVSSCRPLMHLRTKRHDAVVDRLVKARRRGWRILGRNQDVDGSGLRPDIVLYQGNTALLIDVAVPYENRLQAFSDSRRDKAAKYTQVVNNLRRSFATVHNEAIIVGALGSWDRANDSVLRKFVNKRYSNKLRRFICTDVLSMSCDIFNKHVRGRLPDQGRFQRPPPLASHDVASPPPHHTPTTPRATTATHGEELPTFPHRPAPVSSPRPAPNNENPLTTNSPVNMLSSSPPASNATRLERILNDLPRTSHATTITDASSPPAGAQDNFTTHSLPPVSACLQLVERAQPFPPM